MKTVPLTVTGGDPGTLQITVPTIDDYGYLLKTQYGITLYVPGYDNWSGGSNEKWFSGALNTYGNNWYYILPSGSFYAWSGPGLTGTQLATLDASYWTTPSKVYAAQHTVPTVATSTSPTQVQITPAVGYSGILRVIVVAQDSFTSDSKAFSLAVETFLPVQLGDPGPQSTTENTLKTVPLTVTGGNLGTLQITVPTIDDYGYLLKTQYGLTSYVAAYDNWAGAGDKWFTGVTNSYGNGWYYLLPSGSFDAWSGSGLTGTQLAMLNAGYSATPSKLYPAQHTVPTVVTSTSPTQVQITPATGYTGILRVTVTASDGITSDSKTFSLTVAPPLLAAGGEAIATSGVAPLSEAALQPLVNEAIASWAAAGLSTASVDALKHVKFVIGDLPSATLGLDAGDTIYLSRDAAGYGWFIDPTPAQDEEFGATQLPWNKQALDPQAVDRMDLLTVVEHELGHTLGLKDLDPSLSDLMSATLQAGARRKIWAQDVDAVFANNSLD
jgi:hypothetical protein